MQVRATPSRHSRFSTLLRSAVATMCVATIVEGAARQATCPNGLYAEVKTTKGLIVPGAIGYGISGFYAKEKAGEKRFVISPNTTLVYEVEVVKIGR